MVINVGDDPRRCSLIIEELADLLKLTTEAARLVKKHPDDLVLWLDVHSMFEREAELLEELNDWRNWMLGAMSAVEAEEPDRLAAEAKDSRLINMLVDAVARGDAYREQAHETCDSNRYPFLNSWPSDGEYFGEWYTPPFGDEDVEQYRTNARAKVRLGL